MTNEKDTGPPESELEALRRRVRELEAERDRLRESQRALRECERQHRFLFEESQAANLVLSADWKILNVNRRFAESLGYAKDEVLGRSALDFVVPEQRVKALELLEGALKGQVPPNPVIDISGRESVSTFLFAGAPVAIRKDGALTGLLISGIDVTGRREMAEALRDSEAIARALLDATSDRALLLDTEGRILALNAAAARSFGRSQSDLIGRCVHDLVPPDLAAARRATADEIVRSGKPLRTEDRRDGRCLENSHCPVFDAEGRATRMAVFSRDVTEQRLAEAALKESEERYRFLFTAAPVGIGISDPNGKVLAGNKAMREITGFSMEDLRTVNLGSTYVEPAQRELLLKTLAESGRVRDFQVALRRKDGTIYRALLNVDLIELEGRKVHFTTARDVTGQVRAAEELAEQRALLDNILRHVPYYVFWKDRNSVYLGCNENFAPIAGAGSPAEVIGRTDLELAFDEEDARLYRADDRKVMETAEPMLGKEERLCGPAAGERTVLTSKVPLRNAAGEVMGVLGIFTDITARKRAEEALRDSETRFRTLFEKGPVGMAMVGSGRRLLNVNRAFCDMLGYTERELVGGNVSDITHPDDIEADAPAARRAVIEKAPSFRLEKRYLRKDGSVLWGALTSAVIRDERDEPLYALSVVEDVTEQKLAQQALEESEQRERRFRESLAALHAVTVELSTADSFDDLCRRAVELGRSELGFDRLSLWFLTGQSNVARGSFGVDETGRIRDERETEGPVAPDSLMGKVLAERTRLAVSEDEELLDNLGQVAGRGTMALASLWDGQRIIGCVCADDLLTRGAVSPSQREVLTLYAAALGHLCSRIRADEALRESERRFRELFENAPLCIFEEDLTASPPVVLRANRTATETYGYSAEEFSSLPVHEIIAPESQSQFQAAENLLQPGKVLSLEAYNRRRDGARFPVRVVGTIAHGSDRSRVIVMIEDATEEKRAGRALRESEERYRTLVANIPGAVYRCAYDPDRTPEFLSDAIEDLCGYPASEFFGSGDRSLAGIVHPEDRAKVRRAVSDGVSRRQPYVIEYRVIHADGAPRWVHEKGRGVFASDGPPLWLDGAIFDVTEPKRTERELRIKDSAVESSINAIALADLEGKLTYVNRSFLGLWGYGGAEEVLGRPVVMFWQAPQRAGEVLDAVRKHGSWTAELTARRKDGTSFEVSLSASVVANERAEPVCLMSWFLDVTERKRAERALRESKDRLQYVIDNTSDVIFEIDLDGNYTFASRAAEGITGYPLEKLLTMNMGELIVPERREGVFGRLRRRIAGERLGQPFTFDIVRSDGQRVTLELTTAGAYREGKMVGVQGSARDITERVRAEEALRAARARLTSAREEERRRLAGELHDSVGQGLIALRLGLHALLDAPQPAPDAIGKMCAQCDALTAEVRRVGRGLYPPTLESLGLRSALNQLAQDFETQSRVAIGCSVSPAVERFRPEVEIALFRIAQEAVTNAIRHGKARLVSLGLSHEDGQAVLTVTDDGAGFDPDKTSGNGLGLSGMRERMQSLEGTLEITSRAGRTRVKAAVRTESLPAGPAAG